MRQIVILFLLAATILLGFCAETALGVPFHFPIKVNDKKCFTEELTTTRYSFSYSMRRALAQFISITVTGENGVKLWEQRTVTEEGRTVLVPPTAGPYTICFHTSKKAKSVTVPLLVQMDLELESLEMERNAKSYGRDNDGPNEDPAIPQAEYLDRTIRAVKDSYDYFKTREAALRNTNESSNSRMLIITLLSIALVVVVTVFKEYKLQKFLKKKKFLD